MSNSRAISRRRGTKEQHDSFTGVNAEITVDTTNNRAVVHDGETAGGHPMAPVAYVDDKASLLEDDIDNSATELSSRIDYIKDDQWNYDSTFDLDIGDNAGTEKLHELTSEWDIVKIVFGKDFGGTGNLVNLRFNQEEGSVYRYFDRTGLELLDQTEIRLANDIEDIESQTLYVTGKYRGSLVATLQGSLRDASFQTGGIKYETQAVKSLKYITFMMSGGNDRRIYGEVYGMNIGDRLQERRERITFESENTAFTRSHNNRTRNMVVVGDTLYWMQSDRLTSFDISDKLTPVESDNIVLGELGFIGLRVTSDGYAYCATGSDSPNDNKIFVVNVNDPSNMVHEATFEDADVYGSHGLALSPDENTLYVTAFNADKFTSIDITNRTTLQKLDSIDMVRCHDVDITPDGDFAIVTRYNNPITAVVSVDVSDPSNMQILDTLSYGDTPNKGAGARLSVDENSRYFFFGLSDGDGQSGHLVCVDCIDPHNLKEISRIRAVSFPYRMRIRPTSSDTNLIAVGQPQVPSKYRESTGGYIVQMFDIRDKNKLRLTSYNIQHKDIEADDLAMLDLEIDSGGNTAVYGGVRGKEDGPNSLLAVYSFDFG